MRKPEVLPDGTGWVGERVRMKDRPSKCGVVERMATGRALAMIVKFEDEQDGRYCYASALEKMK